MKVSIWTAVIVIIVGLYDLAFAFNRRQRPRGQGTVRLFYVLGGIFVLGGIVMLWLH